MIQGRTYILWNLEREKAVKKYERKMKMIISLSIFLMVILIQSDIGLSPKSTMNQTLLLSNAQTKKKKHLWFQPFSIILRFQLCQKSLNMYLCILIKKFKTILLLSVNSYLTRFMRISVDLIASTFENNSILQTYLVK